MLTRWGDFERSLSWVNELSRRLEETFHGFERGWFPSERGTFLTGHWPRTNLFDAEKKWVLQAELPGLSEQDVTLTVQQGTFAISGERKSDAPEGYSVHRQERVPIKFSRSFALPSQIDPEKVKASMKNGVLTVEMAKLPEAQPKQISIKAS